MTVAFVKYIENDFVVLDKTEAKPKAWRDSDLTSCSEVEAEAGESGEAQIQARPWHWRWRIFVL